jgi:type VI protein secretion system component VasF
VQDDRSRRLSRHERIQRDIERSKQSRVPTWAYALALVAMIAAVAGVALVFAPR